MSHQAIIYEKKNKIAYLTLNRPHRGNSYDKVMENEVIEVWQDVKEDENIWGVIVTGGGDKFFCSGIDQRAAYEQDSFHKKGGSNPSNFPNRPKGMWKPVLVAINGICCGAGVHWIWQNDIIICSEQATFFDPHVTRGWVPVREMLGMATRLPFAVVMRMAVTGVTERIDAKRAYDLGLVTEVVPHDRLIARSTEIMEQIFEQSPLAVRAIIEILHRGMGLEYHFKDSEDMGILIRNPIQTTEDRREGTRAFAEKRKPVWKAK